MNPTIEDLEDTFKIGYEAYEASKIEAAEAWDMFHNRQYTTEQKAILTNRGQPIETFNVIKVFARMLIGYYSNVVSSIKAVPTDLKDIPTASVLSDTITYILKKNFFEALGDRLKLCGIISGLMVCYVNVKDSGRRDQFGRVIYTVELSYVPDSEVVLDPLSRKEDYSDATYIHRFKWMDEASVKKEFGSKAMDNLEAYYNHLNVDEAEFVYAYNGEFTGRYKLHNNYLIVHSVVKAEDGKTYSVYWSNQVILKKTDITKKITGFPYRVQKVHTSDKTEYYGVFREVLESQKAINQALIKIQLLVNTHKAFVETGAVDSIAEFTAAFNRVSGVIEVTELKGIKIENMSADIQQQYIIIDKAFDRIQRVLNINDSFLGMAFASDSGRKVKLQQNATIVALRYLTLRFEEFYQMLGTDIAALIKQYYTAHQVLRIADDISGERWVELNRPLVVQQGVDPNTGQPVQQLVLEEVTDPVTGKVMTDDDGNILVAPVPEAETEVAFTDVDIEITSTAYNDEDEKNQLMLETFLSGNIGNLLAQINPGGFFKAASLAIKTMKTKHSPDISQILEETAAALQGNPQAQSQASMIAQGNGSQLNQTPKSAQLKLPQNTNEEV